MTKAELEEQIKKDNLPTMVEFYADWCGPCHVMEPMLNELRTELEGKAKIIRIDVDAEQALSQEYDVLSIPTMVFYRDGKIVKELVGLQQKPALLPFLTA